MSEYQSLSPESIWASIKFQDGLSRLLSTHGKRKAWLDRLARAGIY